MRNKETSDFEILDEITKHREELVENFIKNFTDDIKDEIINFKEVIIKNLQNENVRLIYIYIYMYIYICNTIIII